MSDYIKDPSLEDFINQFNKDLNKLNRKNQDAVSDLNAANEIPVRKVLADVYNDFFGMPESVSASSGSNPASKGKKSAKDMNVEEIIADLKKEEQELEQIGMGKKAEGSGLIGNASDKDPAASGDNVADANAGNADPDRSDSGNADSGNADSDCSGLPEVKQGELPKEPEKSGMEQLNELVGLNNIKHDVAELVALAKVRKLREEMGLKFVPTSLHLVFSGNPGTGKTTVARILAKLYKEIGILSKGQLVETDRSSLVAGYVGQTAIKTQQKIEEAMGGILFVDEAYTLVRSEGPDFGQEAIDTILKAMEDHRDDFIVIVAGYTDLMKEFIDSNPGLKSRFNKYIHFEDYTAEELNKIFDSNCEKYSYKLTPEAREAVTARIEKLVEEKDDNFANAREIRNLFEEIITNQAARIAELEAPTEEDLMTILPGDLEDGIGGGSEADSSLPEQV